MDRHCPGTYFLGWAVDGHGKKKKEKTLIAPCNALQRSRHDRALSQQHEGLVLLVIIGIMTVGLV